MFNTISILILNGDEAQRIFLFVEVAFDDAVRRSQSFTTCCQPTPSNNKTLIKSLFFGG